MLARALRSLVLGAFLLVAAAGAALAVKPDEKLADPALEGRARALSSEIRCMVCQNQSIDDSDAPLARDLRLLVRERLAKGDSNDAVLDFLVARYGEFVLLRPRLEVHTLILWLSPIAVLLLGGALAATTLRRRREAAAAGEAPLSPEERRRLDDILKA